MLLSLPGIVLLAALLYLVASKAGWLEAIARWSKRPPGRRSGGPPGPSRQPPADASPRRLEVFEEFLRDLGHDDKPDA